MPRLDSIAWVYALLMGSLDSGKYASNIILMIIFMILISFSWSVTKNCPSIEKYLLFQTKFLTCDFLRRKIIWRIICIAIVIVDCIINSHSGSVPSTSTASWKAYSRRPWICSLSNDATDALVEQRKLSNPTVCLLAKHLVWVHSQSGRTVTSFRLLSWQIWNFIALTLAIMTLF